MVNSCVVFACSNSVKNSENLSFYRFPKVNSRFKKEYRDLLYKRRQAWFRCLKRENISENQLDGLRICGKHFISGKPADFRKTENPDWIPSINMGYEQHGISSKSKVKRLQRNLDRNSIERSNLDLTVHYIDASSCSMDSQLSISEVETGIAVQTDLSLSQLENELIKQNSEIYALRQKLAYFTWANASCLENDEKCRFYTGLPSVRLFILLQTRIDQALSTINIGHLNNFQKLLLTLMKLKNNTSFKGLGYRFDVKPNYISLCFMKVVVLLEYAFRYLVHWPDRDSLTLVMPDCFMRTFGKSVAIIIDCFEITSQKPSNIKAKEQTFSSHKHNYTIKYLIGITPQGFVSFVSDRYEGHASDKFITEDCGILDNLLPGDIVLADRGFTVHEIVSMQCAELKTPQFLRGQTQLYPKDTECARKIATVRMHVEQVIGNLRNKFSILNGPVQINLCTYHYKDKILMDYIVRVCCILANLC